MGSGFGTLIANTVNGLGLDALTLTANHASTGPGDSWVSSGTLTGQVTFDLGGSFVVDSFSFWNQNAGGPGPAGNTGINGVQVLFSTDGVVFNPLAGGPANFAQVPVGGPVGPEIFVFGAVTATHFRFNILGNWGDAGQTGFAEVGFNGADVPEPATLHLMAAVLLALGVSRRLRAR